MQGKLIKEGEKTWSIGTNRNRGSFRGHHQLREEERRKFPTQSLPEMKPLRTTQEKTDIGIKEPVRGAVWWGNLALRLSKSSPVRKKETDGCIRRDDPFLGARVGARDKKQDASDISRSLWKWSSIAGRSKERRIYKKKEKEESLEVTEKANKEGTKQTRARGRKQRKDGKKRNRGAYRYVLRTYKEKKKKEIGITDGHTKKKKKQR